MKWKTDIERYRFRRTLAEVKLKLEEALRYERASQRKGAWPTDRYESSSRRPVSTATTAARR